MIRGSLWCTLVLGLALAGCGNKKSGDPAAAEGSAGEGTEVPAPQPVKKDDRPLYELVNEAADLLDEEASAADIHRAIGLLEQAVSREPENPVVRLDLGVARHRAGDLVGAQREYQAAVGQDQSLGDAWLHLGQILLELGRAGEAESTWRAGLRNDPAHGLLRVALIDRLRTTGRVDEAIEEAKAALQVNADSVEVYNAMGLCWQDKGDLVLARFVYQKALAGIPGADENAWLHLNLGWTYYLEDKAPLAVKELERALELDPYLVPALVNLSRIYLEDRNYEDTVPLLERALEKAPDDPGVQMNLGIAYRGVGQYEQAEKAYRRVMELEPGNPAPWMNLGILFGDYTKDYDAAIEAFGQYVSANGPQAEQAREYMEMVEREKKRVEKRKKAEEDRKRREAERAEREKILKQTEKEKKGKDSDDDAESGDSEPQAPDESSPWGGQ